MKLVYLVILILSAFEELLGTNVALRKACVVCDELLTSQILVDGDINELTPEITSQTCLANTFVEIFLDVSISVHYVVVFEGSNPGGRLDYFKVYEFIGNDILLCSEFTEKSEAKDGNERRVNCKFQPPVDKVRIESRQNAGMTISEIEVHTMFEQENGALYLGCFSEFTGNASFANTVERCLENCRESDRVAGIKNINNCVCGTSFNWDHLRPYFECNYECPPHGRCGGKDIYSLYLVKLILPHYLGCFKVPSGRDVIIENNPGVAACINSCVTYKFAFIWNGSNCGCSNNLVLSDALDINRDRCSSLCAEDGTNRCGGSTMASVYGTCLSPDAALLDCSRLINCELTMNEYGVCEPSAACKSTFYGSYCILKDVDECEVSPCDPNSACINTPVSFHCTCHQGYFDDSGSCEDIDECQFLRCGEDMVCANTRGSFSCNCAQGHERINILDLCEDIDECKTIVCFSENVICRNTKGSYVCECQQGYVYNAHKDACEGSLLVICAYFHVHHWQKDIDECELVLCDNVSSTCTNLVGSFDCVCKPSYIKMERNLCLEIFSDYSSIIRYLYVILAIVIILIAATALGFSGGQRGKR